MLDDPAPTSCFNVVELTSALLKFAPSMTAPVNQQGQTAPASGGGDADEGSANEEHDDRPTVRIRLPDGAK